MLCHCFPFDFILIISEGTTQLQVINYFQITQNFTQYKIYRKTRTVVPSRIQCLIALCFLVVK